MSVDCAVRERLQNVVSGFLDGFSPDCARLRTEALRYVSAMGCHVKNAASCSGDCGSCARGDRVQKEVPASVIDLIDCACDEACSVFAPAYSGAFFPARNCDGVLYAGDIALPGSAFARHVCGCSLLFVFAVTAGNGIDLCIRRAEKLDMPRVPCLQAAGAALIEQVCDYIESAVRRVVVVEGFEICSRFSPGYGDLPLTVQRSLFDVMDITKKTGITLTDSCLMLPAKSVTAVIGIKPS